MSNQDRSMTLEPQRLPPMLVLDGSPAWPCVPPADEDAGARLQGFMAVRREHAVQARARCGRNGRRSLCSPAHRTAGGLLGGRWMPDRGTRRRFMPPCVAMPGARAFGDQPATLWSLARDVARLSASLLGRGRRPRGIRRAPGSEPGPTLPPPRAMPAPQAQLVLQLWRRAGAPATARPAPGVNRRTRGAGQRAFVYLSRVP